MSRPSSAMGCLTRTDMATADETPGGIHSAAVAERFWAKVDKTPGQGPGGDCWEWGAAKHRNGYGQFKAGAHMGSAHRVCFELTKGPIPKGVMVGRTCDNIGCVNPTHLLLVPTWTERFWSRVQKAESGCWEWQGTKFNTGYGQFCVAGLTRSAHRVCFELTKGLIPEGLLVRHTCDNPGCVNPAHLLLGTIKDNTWDMINRGRSALRSPTAGVRHKTHCKQGHALSDDNLLTVKGKTIFTCRICVRERQRQHYERRRKKKP